VKTIKQQYIIRATPEEVFLALTNPLAIELWSGYPATMEAKEGSEFSLFEGDICGRNVSIVPNRQLVQEWYFGDNQEQSLVTIDLLPEGQKTKVELLHTHIPDEVYEEFKEGWRHIYWKAISEYFK
jgi:uncharacterized protein YndB with AHSA1/START domain